VAEGVWKWAGKSQGVWGTKVLLCGPGAEPWWGSRSKALTS